MEKYIDLRTLVSSDLEENNLRETYKKYLNINFRDREIKNIKDFVKNCPIGTDLSRFYVGYNIPQINKEFDLLRFCEKSILNIEFKGETTTEKKVLEQLQKNEYYLKGFGNYENLKLYTYRSDLDILYKYEDGEIKVVDFDEILKDLNDEIGQMADLETISNPSNYLVSPFNNTEKFLKQNYFLTQRQVEIKKEILKCQPMYIIRGKAGTGKTLLIYDIAFSFMRLNKKVKIYHCGMLNAGHKKLNNNGWKIDRVKDYSLNECKNYDIVIFDEFQRAFDFKQVISDMQSLVGKVTVIFCGDPNQWLQKSERDNKVFDYLDQEIIDLENSFELSNKIRTNREVSSFIKQLFNRRNKNGSDKVNPDKIFIYYFETEEEAIRYSKVLTEENWKLINMTPSLYNPEYIDVFRDDVIDNSHQVVGQEFDKVAVFIGKNFEYINGRLEGKGTYYNSTKMLFENLTRTKSSLCLLIVNNLDVLENCLEILEGK